jgi:hypothetical protein
MAVTANRPKAVKVSMDNRIRPVASRHHQGRELLTPDLASRWPAVRSAWASRRARQHHLGSGASSFPYNKGDELKP